MHHENFLWKSLQEEMEIFRDRYPHINRHAIYSQNYNEVLPSLQESVNPYPSQWFQTTGKMYTQNVCFGYSFLLNKFPQIIVIYYLSGFSMLIWFSWVIFSLHDVCHSGSQSSGGVIWLGHPRKGTHMDDWCWLSFGGAQWGLLNSQYPTSGCPDLVNKNKGHQVKFQFQINKITLYLAYFC